MTVAYTATTSSQGGSCEHRHPTVAEAMGCLTGDRHLEAVEAGERRPLTDLEFAAMLGQLERREEEKGV
jgi:hypothetical protein